MSNRAIFVWPRQTGCVPNILTLDDRMVHAPRGVDDNIPENLLGQVPVLGGGPSADIGRREKRRHKNPGILHDLFSVKELQLDRYISADPHPPQPTLSRPARQHFCGLVS